MAAHSRTVSHGRQNLKKESDIQDGLHGGTGSRPDGEVAGNSEGWILSIELTGKNPSILTWCLYFSRVCSRIRVFSWSRCRIVTE
jgi:hypothetical protein